ncbi:MAG: L,D-transpeptidase [Akkermansiaceae bacterium]|nr:L,D-transpeptidase [Akkermansiaceae bacterium]
MKFSAFLAAAGFALLLNSCATFPGLPTNEGVGLKRTTPPLPVIAGEIGYSYWTEDGTEAPLRVTIDLSDQTAYFYRAGMKVGQSRVATGRAGHATPTGTFTISEKVAGKRSTLYGRIYDAEGLLVNGDADSRKDRVPPGGEFVGAPMPYWMRLTGYGIGMHVGAIPNPGTPASHGCIRMPEEMARTLFEKAPAGTQVTIVE